MKNTDIEKAQAAYTVSDEIMDMRLSLERAEYVMQDINEEYFNKLDKRKESDHAAILWEHPRYTVKSDIVVEYLYKVRVRLDALWEQAQQAIQERQKEKEAQQK